MCMMISSQHCVCNYCFSSQAGFHKQQIVILVYEQQLLSWELRGQIRELSGKIKIQTACVCMYVTHSHQVWVEIIQQTGGKQTEEEW